MIFYFFLLFYQYKKTLQYMIQFILASIMTDNLISVFKMLLVLDIFIFCAGVLISCFKIVCKLIYLFFYIRECRNNFIITNMDMHIQMCNYVI